MKNKIDIHKHFPINTKDKIDLICHEIEKIENIDFQNIQDLKQEIMLQINKLKIQLYFNERVTEIAEKLIQTKYSETITDELIITIFIGREISVIDNNYPINNNLQDFLRTKGFEVDFDTTLKMDMIKVSIQYLRMLMINNPKKIPTYILSAIENNKILENSKVHNRSDETHIGIKRPIARKRKHGPDCLPVPRAFIHNERPGDVYGKEGNWYKVINIRSK
ncbi:MAG: hypothetical protein RR259_09980 [Odoribacter sp.]